MSRFDYVDDDEGSIPWAFWQPIVSRALAGKRGQRALAEFEEALLALPKRELIDSALATDDGVCAVGALVAHKLAKQEGLDMAAAMAAMPHGQPDDESIFETAEAGRNAGLTWAVAWHMAYLNDETFSDATPEGRYEQILAWVRRAQGKPDTVAA